MDTIKINRCIIDIQKSLTEHEVRDCLLQSDIFLKGGDFHASKYCIDKFIKSEMDQQSHALRGMGRINDAIPRFAGYFRYFILHLYEDEIKELEDLFKELIYIGYLTHIAIYEKKLNSSQCKDQYTLYQIWNMYILGIQKENFSRGIKVIEESSEKTRNQIREKLRNLEFPLQNHEEELLNEVLLFYGLCGFSLRRGEVGFRF